MTFGNNLETVSIAVGCLDNKKKCFYQYEVIMVTVCAVFCGLNEVEI